MKQIGRIITDFLLTVPFLMVLSTVFVVDNSLAHGVVSGKYFWFYASMGVVSITTLIFVATRKLHFRLTMFDWLILLFAGNILFTSLVINDASQNTSKLVLLALLVVLYFNFILVRRSLRLRRVRNKALLCKDASQRLALSNDVVTDYAERGVFFLLLLPD